MKKIVCFLLLFMLSFVAIGCTNDVDNSSNTNDNNVSVNTNESKKDIYTEEHDVTEKEETSDNIYDLKAIYEFVKGEYDFKDFKEFHNNINVTMLDVTGEGTEEAILAYDYLDRPIIFLSVDNGEFKIIPSDVESGHYGTTEISVDNKFVLVKGVTGGTGERIEYLDLGYYTGKEIKHVDAIVLTDDAANPDSIWEGKGYVKMTDDADGYENFQYYYNLFIDGKHIQDIRKKYEFNKNTYTYDVSIIEGGFDKLNENNNQQNTETNVEGKSDTNSDINQEVNNDISKGYTYEIKNNALFIKYNNTGNEVKVAGNNSVQILYAQKSFDESRLYFTEEAKFEASGQATSYVDLNTFEVNFIAEGAFNFDIDLDPYKNHVVLSKEIDGTTMRFVYDSNGNKICDLGVTVEDDIVSQISERIEGESFKLKGFTSENINGENINYSDYITVVIPMHNTVNIDNLTRETCSFSDDINNVKVKFSVFGEMKDIKITYYNNMDSEGEVENVDDLKNSYLDIFAPFSTDMSYVKVTGKVYVGEGTFVDVEFTLDDARDVSAYQIIKY